MSTILVIRPRGPYGRALLPSGTKVIECSAEHLPGSSLLEELPAEHLGCIVLEDMRAADLDCEVSAALMRGAKGHSCPVVTRWTQLAPDDAR